MRIFRLVLMAVGALTVLGLIALAVFILYMRSIFGTDDYAFSRERWVAEGREPAPENDRNQMLSEVEPRLQPGITAARVDEILGPPDNVSEDKRTITYELGLTPFGVDYHYLHIAFDAQGRLVRHWIEQG